MSVRSWSLKSFGVKIGFWTLLSALILIQGSENKIRALAGNQCPETIWLKIWGSIFFGGVYKKMEPRKKLNNVSADWLPGSALILFWGPTKKSMHYVDIQYESWQTYHWYPFMFWTHLYWAHEWVNQRKTEFKFSADYLANSPPKTLDLSFWNPLVHRNIEIYS